MPQPAVDFYDYRLVLMQVATARVKSAIGRTGASVDYARWTVHIESSMWPRHISDGAGFDFDTEYGTIEVRKGF